MCRIVLVLALPWIVGCAASLKIENMVTDQTSFGAQHPVTVAVRATGGSPGVQWFSGTISPETP